MSIRERMALIPREFKRDERGWLLKVLDGGEAQLPGRVGEIYLTMALPGQVRGNHYHGTCHEWFTVLQGSAEVVVADPTTGERVEFLLTETTPVTLHVPPGLAHALRAVGEPPAPMLLVAYASERYDPADTFSFPLL